MTIPTLEAERLRLRQPALPGFQDHAACPASDPAIHERGPMYERGDLVFRHPGPEAAA